MQIWDRRKLTERITSLVRRCHVTRNIDGGKYRQLHTQDWVDTDRQDIPHFQNAGFMSRAKPSKNTETITVDVDADPTHSVAIVVTAEQEPDCDEGEAIHYSPEKPENQIKVTETGICIEAEGQELIQVLIDALDAANVPLGGVLTPQITQLTLMKC